MRLPVCARRVDLRAGFAVLRPPRFALVAFAMVVLLPPFTLHCQACSKRY
jgi:hypothetical protein